MQYAPLTQPFYKCVKVVGVNIHVSKLLVLTFCLVITVLSGYYEYILSLTLASNKHSSSIHLNFTANTKTVANLESSQRENQKEEKLTNPSCPEIPQGKLYQIICL